MTIRDKKLRDRLDVCATCEHLSVNRCTIANRIAPMIAKNDEHCPDGRFPGDPDGLKRDRQPGEGRNKPFMGNVPDPVPKSKRQLATRSTLWNSARLTISVVIPCHNYARYLGECLVSVMSQTRQPLEVLVIDDASDDHPEEIVKQFPGVRIERVDFQNVWESRRFGYENTGGDALLFLDADNTIPPNYLEGVERFDSPNVGVVYADLNRFGTRPSQSDFPDRYDKHSLFRDNYVDAGSLVRREAIRVSRPFDYEIDPRNTSEDWFFFKRLAADRWEFRKQQARLNYRTHDDQCSLNHRRERVAPVFYKVAGLHLEPITLFVPLSGRTEIFRDHLSLFLNRQTWPREQCALVLFDSSQDVEFSRAVKEWITDCDYLDVRHVQTSVADKGISDINRRQRDIEDQVQLACSRIYNRCARLLETEFVWILEDDVIPPDNAAEVMLRNFTPEVGTVSIPYESRYDPDYVCWGFDGKRVKRPAIPFAQEVHGTGFGCLMARSELFRNHVFQIPPGQRWYDPTFFKLMDPRYTRLLDWNHEAEHLGERHHLEHKGESLVPME